MNFGLLLEVSIYMKQRVLEQVEVNSKIIVEGIAGGEAIPATLVFKKLVTTSSEIKRIMEEANFDQKCAGVIT